MIHKDLFGSVGNIDVADFSQFIVAVMLCCLCSVARPFPSHVKPAQVLEENDYHYLCGLLSNRGSYPNVPGVAYLDSSETRPRET